MRLKLPTKSVAFLLPREGAPSSQISWGAKPREGAPSSQISWGAKPREGAPSSQISWNDR